MKKIISILACVCLLLSVMIVPISAAEASATITFDDKAKRTEYSTSIQVWEENGIKVTNNKGASTSNVGDYANPARFYKSAEVIIEYPAMTKIEVTAGSATYAQAWANSNTDANATVTVSGSVATIVFATAVDSYTVASLSAQSRVASMTVYASSSEGGSDPVDPPVEEDPVFDPTGKTPAEIVDAAYALESGAAFEKTATLTGVIISVNAPYSEQYGNVTVTIAVEGKEDKPIECYRLAGEGADTITIDDTITVTGILKNYNGKIEFDAGCTLDAVVKGDYEVVVPTDPKEIVDAAFALETGTSLLYEATLQGEVVSIHTPYDETFGNVSVVISVEGSEGMKDLLCYRLKAGEGADASTVKVGDVIAVTGTIKNYNGTIEFDSGCTFVMIEAAVEETFEGTDPEAPIELAVNESVPANVKEIKVPAGGTVFVKAADANGILHVTSTTGACTLINGKANQLEISDAADLTLCGYEMVNIYNPGEETITLYVFLEAGAGEVVGTWDNPEVLELEENPWMPQFPPSANAQTELEAGNQGYFYKITATEDGAFVVTVSAYDPTTEYWDSVGYQMSITNNTTSWQSEFIARAVDAEDYSESVFVPVKAGDELLINAGTFNPADVWNAPAATLNVQINFTTVGAYDYPEVLTETGTYTATVEAGSQGYYYEYIVTEDGNVTVTMNDASYQYQVNVVPADEEDWGAYVYGEPHASSDDPAVPSETVAVKAGDTVSIMVNTFNPDDAWNAPAGTVNWTLDFAEKVVIPGKITVSDAEAEIGKEFTVTIDISENPGIISAGLDVVYDSTVLELVSAEAGELTTTTTSVDEDLDNYNFGPIENNPFKITWVDALAEENVATNGVFVTLTFKVKDDATVGTSEVSVTLREDDTFDVELNNVAFEATAGTVTIIEATGMPGDANEDGTVNLRDYALVLQSCNGGDVTINEDNSDVNNDGIVNLRDYALILQSCNGWDVTLQ